MHFPQIRLQTGRQIAREISYASSASTKGGRVVIRAMENATGRLRLIKRAEGYHAEVAAGADFWRVITDRYKLNLNVTQGSLDHIPQTGPLIMVSNHPYGILDGLMMGRILSTRRGTDFKILANSVFRKAPDLERVILPISFEDSKDAIKQNVVTRRDAVSFLSNGGAIGVFPGGTVSTSARPFSRPLDPKWRNFTAKLVAKSGASVVPVYFEGSNSRLFQLASHLHTTLRMGLLVREFRARVGTDVGVRIGQPILPADLTAYKHDAKSCMDFLRKATYDLSDAPLMADTLGREFDALYKDKG